MMSRAAMVSRLLATTPMTAVLMAIAGTVQAAPHALAESDLDQVRAGTAGRLSSVDDPVPGPGRRRDAVIIGDAALETRLDDIVELSGNVQRDARALSLVNAAASDAVNLANVIGPGAPALPAGPRATQHNGVSQVEHAGAALEAWVAPGGPEHRRASTSLSRGSQRNRVQSDQVVDRSVVQRSESHRVNAQVPEFSPARDWEVNLDLGTMPDIALPDFGFDWTAGKEPGRFGVAAEFTGLTLEGPGLDLGNVRADGDDLVVRGGSITLPGITLPDVRGELCAGKCFSGTVKGTTIGNQTLSLDVGDIRLTGANPFKDFDLQLGQGIAAVGSGSFDIQGIGAEVTASLEFQLPSLSGKTISFDIEPSLDFVPEELRGTARDVLPGFPSKTIELGDIELPGASFELTLVDLDAPGFSGRFGFSGNVEDGVICLSLASTQCGEQSFSREEIVSRVENRATYLEESFSEYEEYAESQEGRRRPGASIGEAEAGTIVLGRGEANVEDYRVVRISGNVQRDLRAMNLANATTATVASTANVFGAARPGAGGTAAAGNVSQSNVFVQGFR